MCMEPLRFVEVSDSVWPVWRGAEKLVETRDHAARERPDRKTGQCRLLGVPGERTAERGASGTVGSFVVLFCLGGTRISRFWCETD